MSVLTTETEWKTDEFWWENLSSIDDETGLVLATLDDYVFEIETGGQEIDGEFGGLYERAKDLERLFLDLASFQDEMAYYACLCAAHFEVDFGGMSELYSGQTMSQGLVFENDGDHDHCSCGGHFNKTGRCEKCGSYRLV